MSPLKKIQPGSALWGILVGVGLAIAIAACASGRSSPGAVGGLDQRKQDITKLWNEIGDWRERDGLIRDPLAGMSRNDMQQIPKSPVAKIRQCPNEEEPPKTDQCTDVCALKDDICDNAADICRIASDLGDDAWAQKRCKSAKASCKEATDKCCGCLADETKAADEGTDRSKAIF
jgi:hypothetical protein